MRHEFIAAETRADDRWSPIAAPSCAEISRQLEGGSPVIYVPPNPVIDLEPNRPERMSVEALKKAVYDANIAIVEAGLVELTWGNASAVDREAGVVAIKPSGIEYGNLRPEHIVVLSLETGEVVQSDLKPSSDTATHLHLYREFDGVAAVVHTHSSYAVSWAQAEREIPCLGTTHADHFYGTIPVTRRLVGGEIRNDYEHHTGAVIVERFRKGGIDPLEMPAVLVAGHGPFAWGKTVQSAVENAVALEATARMAMDTYRINPQANPIDRELLDRHFFRKHGAGAYYGQ